MVIAKFTVTNIQPSTHIPEGFSITLMPVVQGSPENEEFYKSTPAGQITLETVNKEAVDKFELHSSYYVHFTKAME